MSDPRERGAQHDAARRARVAKALRALSSAAAVAAFGGAGASFASNVTAGIAWRGGFSISATPAALDRTALAVAMGFYGVASGAACLCLFGMGWFVAGYFARVLETRAAREDAGCGEGGGGKDA